MNVMLKPGIFSICHKCRGVNLGFRILYMFQHPSHCLVIQRCFVVVIIPLYEFWDLIHVVATGPVNLQRTTFGCEIGRLLQENFNSNLEYVWEDH